MRVLGVETSCDETAAAVVEGGRHVRSNAVYSQIEQHAEFGGVVPEVASRAHLEQLPGLMDRAVRDAGLDWPDLSAVACTQGPGLATSLLIGCVMARAAAASLALPCVGVNHLEAHIHSLFLDGRTASPETDGPLLVLLVSGGHTALIEVTGLRTYRQIGRTVDDAAGEALDKGAKLLGLGYPGGPAIERAAENGRADAVDFPRGRVKSASLTGSLEPGYCFSFSGIKTALLYHLREQPLDPDDHQRRADLAACYQAAVVDSLTEKMKRVLTDQPDYRLACAGGVSRNTLLRNKLKALSNRFGLPLSLADPVYGTDNAAMIAGLGGLMLERGEPAAPLGIQPSWPVG